VDTVKPSSPRLARPLRATPDSAPLHMPEQSLAPVALFRVMRRLFLLPQPGAGSLESGS